MKTVSALLLALLLMPLSLLSQNAPVSRTFISHEKGVFSLDWSPDGKLLATASLDGSVSLWEAKGRLIRKMQIHTMSALGVAFSPDGESLASASADKTLAIFSLEGRIEHRVSGHRSDVLSLAWSPDGRYLASGSEDMTVRVHTKTGSLVSTLTGQMQPVTALEFSQDGKYLVIAERGTHLLIRETSRWTTEKLIQAHRDVVWDTAISKDNRFIATGSKDLSLRIWTIDGKPHLAFDNLPSEVWTLAFSPDTSRIACGLKSGLTLVYDLATRRLLHSLAGHKAGVLGIAWSPDGKYLATASQDTTVKIWEGL
jgi:WD40 repeat protein